MTQFAMLRLVAAAGLLAVGCGHSMAQPANDPSGGSVDNTITEGTGTSKGDTTGSGSSLPSSTGTGPGDVSSGAPAGAPAATGSGHGAQ